MLFNRICQLILFVALFFITSEFAHADIYYYATANYQGGSIDAEIVDIEPVTLNHSPAYSNQDVIWRVDSYASHGIVGTRTQSTNVNANLGTSSTTSSLARFHTDDLVFSSSSSDPITTSLNFHMFGSDILARCCAAGFARNDIAIRIGIGNHVFGGSYYRQINSDGSVGEGRGQMLISLPGEEFDTGLTTPEFTVDANTPLEFWLELETTGTTPNRAYSHALADVLLRLPKGDVFNNLADGVTVNSIEAKISNNRFYGSSIPEPGTVGILGLFFGSTILLRRRKRVGRCSMA